MNEYLGEFWNGKTVKSEKEIASFNQVNESRIRYFKPFFKGKECIDIGSGLGYGTKSLRNIGLIVDAIGPDPQLAKENNAMNHTLEDLPTGKSYDILWLSHVLEHMEYPLAFLNKCYDITKESGVLCIMVPDCTNPLTEKESRENKYHKWHFTRDAIKDLCKQSDYKVLEIQSFKKITGNKLRLQKILKTQYYYPYTKTDENDGYELRVVLKSKRS